MDVTDALAAVLTRLGELDEGAHSDSDLVAAARRWLSTPPLVPTVVGTRPFGHVHIDWSKLVDDHRVVNEEQAMREREYFDRWFGRGQFTRITDVTP